MAGVLTGLEVLLHERPKMLKGKRIGLLAHQASIDGRARSTFDCLKEDLHYDIVRIFGPEHGFAASAQDMIGVGPAYHKGVEVISLYGDSFESLFPSKEQLEGLDWLVVDLQDIGSRYYTYFTTLGFCMERCAEIGLPLLLLDRPNPIGGSITEGNLLQNGIRSFVGWYPLPVRHGMSIGELALWLKNRLGLNLQLEVVQMRNYRRPMWYDECGLLWVLPSPNMPTLETAMVYPGGCLLEGTNLSEGRGTTRPFELFGAPWLNAEAVISAMQKHCIEGAVFRATTYRPTFHKYAGQDCNAIQVHVTDRDRFKPYLCYLLLLREIFLLHPADFKWRTETYEFVKEPIAIDLLTGSPELRTMIESGADRTEIEMESRIGLEDFLHERKDFLLYPY